MKQDFIEIKEEFKKVGDKIDREMFYKSGDEWISLRVDKDFPVVFYDPPGKKVKYVHKFSKRSPRELEEMKKVS